MSNLVKQVAKMKKSLNVFANAVDRFWNLVERQERDVRENSHRGRLPPSCLGDPWDEDFAEAYEVLAVHLKRYRRPRYFQVPADLAFFHGPLRVETAHQALMFFLNPAGELYGEIGVFDSPEYIAIKEAAMAELAQHQAAQIKAKATPKCSKDSKTLVELIELKGHLRDDLIRRNGKAHWNPLGLKDIQNHFGWSQATATRRMQSLFQSADAMDAYNEVFRETEPPSGYLKKLDDTTLDVDALWFDRSSDEEDEGDEQCSIV